MKYYDQHGRNAAKHWAVDQATVGMVVADTSTCFEFVVTLVTTNPYAACAAAHAKALGVEDVFGHTFQVGPRKNTAQSEVWASNWLPANARHQWDALIAAMCFMENESGPGEMVDPLTLDL